MAGAEAGAAVAAESVEHPRHTVAGSNKLATQLQENARYTEQLEMFKYVLPPIGLGPMSPREVRALGVTTSDLGWHAAICAELARVRTQNEALVPNPSDAGELSNTC